MIADEAIKFFKSIPPFQFLSEADLKTIAENLTMEFYPRDTVILKQDGTASDALRIIKKGGVRVSLKAEDGQDMVLDERGRGHIRARLSHGPGPAEDHGRCPGRHHLLPA